jgi:CubicO group peptidase (beta-lactamase class C family)
MPNVTSILKAVAKYPLVNLPWSYPIYSNTAMALLGAANIAANKLASANPDSEPQTHEDLVNRDIFKPLGFDGSFFRVPVSSVTKQVAVPKDNSGWADTWLDGDDPAGGQYSSLKDLEALMQSLLSPSARGGVVSASVVREWLRPLHVWGPTKQEVGAPWEVMNIDNKFQAYTKGFSVLS